MDTLLVALEPDKLLLFFRNLRELAVDMESFQCALEQAWELPVFLKEKTKHYKTLIMNLYPLKSNIIYLMFLGLILFI